MVLEEEGVKVTAFVVDHTPVEPAVGYRFDYRGRSAVISGDTVYAPALVRAAKGADLLLHDALSAELLKLVEEAAGRAGLDKRRRILADVPDYHATAPQAADAAREAGVGALAITHIIPPLPLKGLEAIFLGDAHEHYSGPLWLARGRRSLPARRGRHGCRARAHDQPRARRLAPPIARRRERVRDGLRWSYAGVRIITGMARPAACFSYSANWGTFSA